MAIGPVFGVSSWSVHRLLGLSWWESPTRSAARKEAWGPGRLAVLDLPAAAAKHGISQLHLCHFHVESRDNGWCGEFRAACGDAGVSLAMLLVDDGDITDPVEHARDTAWVGGWLETAAQLGAQSARVIAGKQKPSPDTLRRSADGLREIVRRGQSEGVRVATENWLDLTAGPDEVNYLLDEVGSDLDFLADFGNWSGPSKYRDLETIVRRARDTHAKAHFDGAKMDEDDFRRCLEACDRTGYAGPFTLIYEGDDADEWAALDRERRFILEHYAAIPERRIA